MKRFGGPALIILVAALFLWRVFVFGECPFFGDVVDQFMPWKMFARSELLQGHLPLWNPYHFAGSPFLANMQSAVLYPIDLLLLPFPIARAFGLSLWIHTFLAGIFAYLFARSFGVSRSGSLLAGIAYMLNGFFMIHIFAGNLLTGYAAAWIPLLLLLGKQVGECFSLPGGGRRLLRSLLWGGPVVALHVLCGHPQMTFYSFFFGLVFAFLVGWLGHGETQTQGRPKRVGKSLAVTVLVLTLGTMLAAVQVVPTAEYAIHSSRSEPLSFEEATQFTFAPAHVMEFLVPEFFGTRFRERSGRVRDTFWSPSWRPLLFERRWETNWKNWSSVYFGSFAFLLALYGMCVRKDEENPIQLFRASLLILTVLALLLSLGPYSPVFRVFFFLPGFKHFRAPSKFTPYMIVPLCVFAGAGLDRALAAVRRSEERWSFRGYWLAAIVLVAVVGLVGFAWRGATPALKDSPVVGQTVGSWISTVSLHALLFISGGGLVLLAWRKRFAGKVPAAALILALHTVQLFWLGGRYLSLRGSAEVGQYWSGIAAMRNAAEEVGAFRESQVRALTGPSPVPAEAWSVARVETLSGYDPMQVGDYVRYIARAEGWDSAGFRDSLVPSRVEAPEYDLLNVKYALTWQRPTIVDSEELRVLGNVHGHWLVERNPYPRAFWLAPGRVSEEPPLRLLDLDKESAYEHQAEYRRISPGEIEVRLDAPEDGYLFLSEVHFPGWKAEQISLPPGKGSKKLKIRQVNDLFRLVPVSAGEQTIRVRYRPLSFFLGCVVTIAAAMCWLALLVHYRRTVRDVGSPGGSR